MQACPVADALYLETIQNTLHNACKRSWHETEDHCTSAPPAVKRRCCLGIHTRVRVNYATTVDVTRVPAPADLFARWGDAVDLNGEDWLSTRPVTPNIRDFVLHTKTSDGPHLAARLAADLITGVARRSVTNAASIINSLRASLTAADVDPQILSAHDDLAILVAVYQRVGMLAERLQEDGKVGLMPTAVTLDMTYLIVLHSLQIALRNLALNNALYQGRGSPVQPLGVPITAQ